MKDNKLAYCNECEDLVEFYVSDEPIKEAYKGEKIQYRFRVGKCSICNCEVATDLEYNTRKSYARIEAYKKKMGLIDLNSIEEIMNKYDIGKETLADIAGFGKVTIKRYFEGFIPAREYSDILIKILNEEKYFFNLVNTNREKLKEVAYRKIVSRHERLKEIDNSKTEQIVNYIITHLEEVTPLALEKLLFFSNGINYAINKTGLIPDESQAWAHGPVYPQIYNKYKKYKFSPIEDGIYSTHGCLVSKLSAKELKTLDLVINTFGLYSPKTLEKISHIQEPWLEKRVGYEENEFGNEVIDEKSVKKYYIEHELNSEEKIMNYIMDVIKNPN